MKFIPHFSVHCANIRVFGETTKFLDEFFASCPNLTLISLAALQIYFLLVPQISQILTDFLPLKVTQISQMTQIFYFFTF